MIILEYPSTSQKMGLLARKDGQYVRPIVGALFDIRLEDVLPAEFLSKALVANFIGKLPDIPELNQHDAYFVSEFNTVRTTSATPKEVKSLLDTGEYLLLPSGPQDKLYQFTGAPWWEYAVVLDDYGQFIKAPKEPRSTEPGPEEIDERLDDYPENRAKTQVVSPVVLQKVHSGAMKENYLARLSRI